MRIVRKRRGNPAVSPIELLTRTMRNLDGDAEKLGRDGLRVRRRRIDTAERRRYNALRRIAYQRSHPKAEDRGPNK